ARATARHRQPRPRRAAHGRYRPRPLQIPNPCTPPRPTPPPRSCNGRSCSTPVPRLAHPHLQVQQPPRRAAVRVRGVPEGDPGAVGIGGGRGGRGEQLGWADGGGGGGGERLQTRCPFPVAKEHGVAIMEGKDEGKPCLRVNHRELPPRHAPRDDAGRQLRRARPRRRTQMVFEPGAAADAGAHAHRVVFGGHTPVLYQHSYLGYGLMYARKRVHRLVEFMHEARRGEGGGEEEGEGEGEVANPCLARGTARTLELKRLVHGADGRRGLVLAKDAPCPVAPCSFAGVYQPALHDAFPAGAGHVLLLSYFYDRLAPLL
ncbi:hypothetical protein JB92DRAFT_3185196, partial [Gautieria morchelliformis]